MLTDLKLYYTRLGTKMNNHTTDPPWITAQSSQINFVSLSCKLLHIATAAAIICVYQLLVVNPHEIYTDGEAALPQSIINHLSSFKNTPTMIAVGGATFKDDWTFLKTTADTKKAAAVCASWSKKYNVGIEVDYEGDASANGAW